MLYSLRQVADEMKIGFAYLCSTGEDIPFHVLLKRRRMMVEEERNHLVNTLSCMFKIALRDLAKLLCVLSR